MTTYLTESRTSGRECIGRRLASLGMTTALHQSLEVGLVCMSDQMLSKRLQAIDRLSECPIYLGNRASGRCYRPRPYQQAGGPPALRRVGHIYALLGQANGLTEVAARQRECGLTLQTVATAPRVVGRQGNGR